MENQLELLAGVKIHVDGIKSNFANLVEVHDDKEESLSFVEDAKLKIALSFSLASLYFILLNATGNEDKSCITCELDSIKKYVGKVQNIENPAVAAPPVAPSLRVDQDAARRIVKHQLALVSNSHECSNNFHSDALSSFEVPSSKRAKKIHSPHQTDKKK